MMVVGVVVVVVLVVTRTLLLQNYNRYKIFRFELSLTETKIP